MRLSRSPGTFATSRACIPSKCARSHSASDKVPVSSPSASTSRSRLGTKNTPPTSSSTPRMSPVWSFTHGSENPCVSPSWRRGTSRWLVGAADPCFLACILTSCLQTRATSMSVAPQQFPRMPDPEMAERVALAQRGDLHARAELTVSHRRIVARMAKKYARADLSFDERIRRGEQGLVIAIEKFDLAKGFLFSTYAVWWIRQAITMGLGGGSGGAGVREPITPRPSSCSESASL